jgi:sulfate adenylyltransferase subunit 1
MLVFWLTRAVGLQQEDISFFTGILMIGFGAILLIPKAQERFATAAGNVAGGTFKVGDEVVALPSGFTTKVKSVGNYNEDVAEAFAPMAITITLEDEIDIARGDMLAKVNNKPEVGQEIDLMLCWMHDKPMNPKGKYLLKHTTNEVRAMITETLYKVDINTLHKLEDDKTIGMNDIARIKLKTAKPLMYDSYKKNRTTGALILIDEFTNDTVGAGMIL